MSSVKKFKISLVDIAIVLIFILLAFAGYKIIAGKTTESSVCAKINFVVEVTGVDKSAIDAVKVGDEIYESRRGHLYGVVSDVKYEKAYALGTDSINGQYVSETFEDKYDLYISVDADATSVTDKDIVVSGDAIKVGDRAYIKNNKFAAAGFFVDLSVYEEVAQ